MAAQELAFARPLDQEIHVARIEWLIDLRPLIGYWRGHVDISDQAS